MLTRGLIRAMSPSYYQSFHPSMKYDEVYSEHRIAQLLSTNAAYISPLKSDDTVIATSFARARIFVYPRYYIRAWSTVYTTRHTIHTIQLWAVKGEPGSNGHQVASQNVFNFFFSCYVEACAKNFAPANKYLGLNECLLEEKKNYIT